MATIVEPLATQTLIQLSDLHLVGPGRLLKDTIDTAGSLASALADVTEAGIEVAGIILSGDLADEGDAAAYERLRLIVEPVAASLGASVLYAMGNHDDRATLRASLLGGPGRQGGGVDAGEGRAPGDPLYYARRLGGLRVVVLDSCVPRRDRGWLDAEQLDWLASELATPAPDGTVLVLHHPPLPSHSALLRLIPLGNPSELADVVRGSDVKIITSGHYHHPSSGVLAGIPVCVAGSTAYSIDPLGPDQRCRGLLGGQFTRIDVYPDGAVATAVPFPSQATLYDNHVDDFVRWLAAQES